MDEEKYVQGKRGPLGKAYEKIRSFFSTDGECTEKYYAEGKYVQSERGPLGKAYEKIRSLVSNN